jgi:serine/threonine protein kinase
MGDIQGPYLSHGRAAVVNALAEPEGASLLAEKLPDLSQRPLAERLLLVRRLAEQVAALHRQGRIHRAIGPDSVAVDERLQPRLPEPPPRRRFGGEESDPDFCPPELVTAGVVELPADAAVAARLLENGGARLDPRRIDVYQLGVLLCRLVSGHSIHEYMISPTVKNLVPSAVRGCLARAIGFDAEEQYADCEGLMAALDELTRPAPPATLAVARGETWPDRRPQTPDDSRATSGDALPAALPPAGAGELPFRRLGPFEIVERLGSGGMGDVYKGYDAALERVVAVKVLSAKLAGDGKFVERFRGEAAAVAGLDHANVVAIHFIGEDSGRHFFAMPYIEGESLAARLERDPRLSLDEALDVAEQCLAGLQAAHAQGLIHRDVKPANVLLERGTGRAVLIDFGLVRRLDDAARRTAPGTILGTADYMAPEQARGQAVDARADLYALGVLMYRMLAGQPPFCGDTPTALVYQHVHEQPRALGDVAPEVPAALAAIVARLLEKDATRRYQTAAEALADLRGFHERLQAGQVAAPVPLPISPAARGGRRRRWLAVAAAAASVAATLVALAAMGGLFHNGEAGQGTAAEVAQAPAQDAGDGWPPAAEDQPPPAGDERAKPQAAAAAAALVLGPGKELPKGRWVDAMAAADPDWDTVSGAWHRGAWDGLSGTWRSQGTDLTVEQSNFQRIMLPVELEGSYELRVEFTRRAPPGTVDIVFPVGERACMLNLAAGLGAVHGLSLVNGRNACDRDNPAVWTPGKLIDLKRYSVLIAVQLEGNKAKVDVSLDNRPMLSWSGRQESLGVEPMFALRRPYRPGLAGNDTAVVYHAALVRLTDGKARMAPPHASPAIDLNDGRWLDLLEAVNPDRDAIRGRWLHDGGALAVAPASRDEEFVRLMLPRPVDGNYDLLAEFTRTKGSDSVAFVLPVGARQCVLNLSAHYGRSAVLEVIDGHPIADILNPALRHPSGLVNGKKYRLLAQVRSHDGNAVIDTWLDGKPFIRWAGKQSALDIPKEWSLPEHWHAGVGANWSGVTFHKIRLRPVDGPAAPGTDVK